MTDTQIIFKRNVLENDPLILIDFLEKYSNLSKTVLKKVLNNGGVWLRLYNKSKLLRNRRATHDLNLESYIEFYFDPKLVNIAIPPAKELTTYRDWGLWYKPPGLLSQGSEFGDHCSIIRQIEKTKNKVWMVHRLDREAHGLMLFAYSKNAAGRFSMLWQNHEVRKIYKVEVLGIIKLPDGQTEGIIEESLDGKHAKTTYSIIDSTEHTTKLLVEIHTGRLHQIRRHFEFMGHPVLGDPKYGVGNKNNEGMRLMAFQLIFRDPFTQKEINFQLPEKDLGVVF